MRIAKYNVMKGTVYKGRPANGGGGGFETSDFPPSAQTARRGEGGGL